MHGHQGAGAWYRRSTLDLGERVKTGRRQAGGLLDVGVRRAVGVNMAVGSATVVQG